MPNSSGTWKTGERVIEAATYVCLDCGELGNRTEIPLEEGAIFPYCKTCDLKDNTYKITSGRK